MLRYLQTLLEVESYNVDTAPSGEAAMEKLQKGAPDVVLLDVLMPGGMDGLQTLEKMRERYPK
ncbi:MAG: response regulator, partial [Terriglobales bacterium]